MNQGTVVRLALALIILCSSCFPSALLAQTASSGPVGLAGRDTDQGSSSRTGRVLDAVGIRTTSFEDETMSANDDRLWPAIETRVGHYGNVGAAAGAVLGGAVGAAGGTVAVPGAGTVTGGQAGAIAGTGVGYTAGVLGAVFLGLLGWSRRKIWDAPKK